VDRSGGGAIVAQRVGWGLERIVRLKRLTLENFRGFESLDVELHPQLTVLVGANGSGKTSILDALVLALTECLSGPTDDASVSHADYRKGTSAASIGLEVFPSDGADLVRFTLEIAGVGNRLSKSVRGPSSITPSDWDTAASICAYPVRRQVGPITSEAPARDTSLLEGWRNEVDFSGFFARFVSAEDIENERRRDDPAHRDPVLESTRQSIERLMPGYTSLRARRSGARMPPRLTLTKDGVEFDLQQLSEGERALAVLAGDIAWRTAIMGHGNRGIVIIDEVDLHLHPKWQADVLPSLLRTFPELQLIVTTHSPIVLSHVDAEHVRLLENFQLVQVPPTRGRDPNSVLTEVFGVPLRPAETQAHIDHIAELIDAERLDEAKQELRRLGDQLGSSDLEVTRLRGLVELMEA
jgi:predicted ATP-binding protein involved in virulence